MDAMWIRLAGHLVCDPNVRKELKTLCDAGGKALSLATAAVLSPVVASVAVTEMATTGKVDLTRKLLCGGSGKKK